jgi:hypothetical protein
MDKTSSCAIWQHNGDCWAKHLITQKLHQKGVLTNATLLFPCWGIIDEM